MDEPDGFEEFILQSDEQTLDQIRKYYGLAKITEGTKQCIRCGKDMLCQLISGRRQQFYCSFCRLTNYGHR